VEGTNEGAGSAWVRRRSTWGYIGLYRSEDGTSCPSRGWTCRSSGAGDRDRSGGFRRSFCHGGPDLSLPSDFCLHDGGRGRQFPYQAIQDLSIPIRRLTP